MQLRKNLAKPKIGPDEERIYSNCYTLTQDGGFFKTVNINPNKAKERIVIASPHAKINIISLKTKFPFINKLTQVGDAITSKGDIWTIYANRPITPICKEKRTKNL